MTKNASIGEEWAARFENLLGEEETHTHPAERGPPGIVAEGLEALTPAEMAKADELTIAAGASGLALMERAGVAIADVVRRHLPPGSRVLVLTGPGNNGGDGFIAARILADNNYAVTIGTLAPREKLTGDAAAAAALWTGNTKILAADIPLDVDVVVDALFGAGLDRPIEGVAAQVIEAVNRSGVPVVAADLPSGVNGRTGQVMGIAVNATESVTFFRVKPGHLLHPGKLRAGRLTVADIGISGQTLDSIRPKTWRNRPGLWVVPPLAPDGHKYTRGHTVVVSGPATRTGAARLAARAALRVGSGLVTLASPLESLSANAAHITAIMLAPMNGTSGLGAILGDTRRNVVVLGPALGVGKPTADLVEVALLSSAAVVIDADGLTSFAGRAKSLFALVKARAGPVVLTPHEGEFARMFPHLAANDSKIERARMAAAESGAVVVLKGPDTVVASPDGHAAVADNAPPQLGTAGSGDVLAGMVGGLLAQGMAAFGAASAAVWLHGEAGTTKGRGLIAEDLPEALPAVFAALAERAR